MGSTIWVIIVVVIIIGIVGAVFGPIMASNSGNKAGSAFSQAYRQEYGVAPSDAAERAISQASAVIYNAMGGGQYAVPSQNLRKCINEYGQAVSWNESKMEFGLGCLLAICSTKNMNVAPGCQWAADVIIDCMSVYCPSMMRRVMGY